MAPEREFSEDDSLPESQADEEDDEENENEDEEELEETADADSDSPAFASAPNRQPLSQLKKPHKSGGKKERKVGGKDGGEDDEDNEKEDDDDDDDSDREEERFRPSLPSPAPAVETLSLSLPGHGGEAVTVAVNLSEPRRRFEVVYKKQLDLLQRDMVLRKLGNDHAAVERFLELEKKREKQQAAAARWAANGGDGNDDDEGDEDVYDKAGGEDGEKEDEEADGDMEETVLRDGYIILPSQNEDDNDDDAVQKGKSEKIRELEEHLLRRREYPHWLPALLANDSFYFEHICKAMYGYAVPPPPLVELEGKKWPKKGGGGSSEPSRRSNHRSVSFSTAAARVDPSDEDAADEENEENEENEEEHLSVRDPARKPSDFYLKTNAFGEDANAEDGNSEASTSCFNSQSTATRQSSHQQPANEGDEENEDDEENAGNHEEEDDAENIVEEKVDNMEEDRADSMPAAAEGAELLSPHSAAVQALASKQHTASIVPVATHSSHHPSAVAAPLTGLPAFTDSNYPFYIVWEASAGEWQLLDVHPDVYIFRAKQAESRRKQAVAARKARAEERRRKREERKQQAGKNKDVDDDDDDDDEEEENGENEEEEEEEEEERVESEGNERDEGGQETDADSENGDDADDGERTTKKKKRSPFLRSLPEFEKESMHVVDALMLAAMRCPSALRLMLLQNAGGTGATATGSKETNSEDGTDLNGGNSEDDDNEEDSNGQGTSASPKNYAARAAASERLLSLRHVEAWMKEDFAVGFPYLSSVYSALLSARRLDAPRLPYPIIANGGSGIGLLFDFNLFFTKSYIFSYPSALLLLGGQQCKGLDPASKRLESVASPRSAAALGTMQSLLYAGLAPRTAIDRRNLTTPESMQLLLWLLLTVPSSSLIAWGLEGKQQVIRAIENRQAEGANAGLAMAESEQEEEEEDDEEDAEEDPDEDVVDEMNEVMILERILAQAKQRETKTLRDRRRQLRSLKKKLGGALPVKRNSISTCTAEEEVHVAEKAVAGAVKGEEDGDSEDGTQQGEEMMTWQALTGTIADVEKSVASLSGKDGSFSFCPSPLLLQTAMEIRRRLGLEKADKSPSTYTLSFVMEKQLATFARCVEDGKITGDDIVTTSFHTDFSRREARRWQDSGRGSTAAGNRKSGDGLEKFLSFSLSSASLPPSPPNVESSNRRKEKASRESPLKSQQQQQHLLRKQIIYQSDLLLLLLALTSTTDQASAALNARLAAREAASQARGSIVTVVKSTDGTDRSQASRANLPNQAGVRHSSNKQHTSVHGGRESDAKGFRKTTSAAAATDGSFEAAAEASGNPVDGHTELFHTLLHAKLKKQAGHVRVGRLAASLLDKMRSGMFRLLFLALPRFQRRATMQLLCDAAPLYQLLGGNERAPLMDLVTSWRLETGSGSHHSGSTGNAGGSHHRNRATITTIASGVGERFSSPEPTKLQGKNALSPPQVSLLAKNSYLDIFVWTFWSEIAYRLEAGLYTAETGEQIRYLLPSLLTKVKECVTAYNKVVATVVNGKLLKHSVVHRAVVSSHAVHEKRSQALMQLVRTFPTAGAAVSSAAAAKQAIAATAAEAEDSGFLHLLSPYSEEYRREEDRLRALFRPLPMAHRTIYTPELLFSLLFTTSELDLVAVRYVCALRHVLTVREGGPFALSKQQHQQHDHHASGGDGVYSAVTGQHQQQQAGLCSGASSVSAKRSASIGMATASLSSVAWVSMPGSSTSSIATAAAKKWDSAKKEAACAATGREVPALEFAIRTGNMRAARLLVFLGAPLDDMSFGGACTLETLADRCLTREDSHTLKAIAARRLESSKADPDWQFGAICIA